MGVHIENVNTETVCNGDNFELYASVDPLTLRFSFIFSPSITLSFFYGMGRGEAGTLSLTAPLQHMNYEKKVRYEL